MKNPTRHKIAHKVQLAELRRETGLIRHQQKIGGSKALYREQKINKAKMAVAKAGVILAKEKMRYDFSNDPWAMMVWEPQFSYDNAVARLEKLTKRVKDYGDE